MTELDLSPQMAVVRPKLKDVVRDIDHRGAYGTILLSSKRGLRIEVDNHIEQIVQAPPADGTVVTAFDGHTIHERAVGGFDHAEILKSAGEVSAGITTQRGAAVDLGPERKGDYVTPMKIAPESLSTKEKLERCRELQRRVRGLGKQVVNVRLLYAERNELSVFCSRNADLGQRVQRVWLYLIIIAGGADGARRYDLAVKSGTGGWELLSFTDEEIESLVDNAQALLSAERIEPGEYTVVTSPIVSGVICHESFGHGVEADMFLKKRARAAHYMNKVVASPLVNIIDDPGVPAGFGSYFFDDEGWLASPTQIVENGVFRRGITDLYSATALNLQRSANGRRQDFSRKAYARMSNTFFARGDTPLADLFAQAGNGVYLEKASSGVEDPLGWGIQVTCTYGREIKNGKLTGRLFAPVGMTGYVPDVLQSISAVGNEWEPSGGTCGKGHKEAVSVGDGGPHLLLKARLG